MTLKKSFLIIFIVSLLFAFTTIVKAQTVDTNQISPTIQPTVTKPPTVNAVNKAAIENKIKGNINKTVENFQTLLEEKRKVASDSYRLKIQTFKAKLDLIKDQKKKELTDKINNKIADLNKKYTDKFMEVLDKLSNILTTLTDKANAAKAAGKDTTNLFNAITSAQNKITAAKTAVLDQAGTNYVAQISGDATLFTSVGQIVRQFEADIIAVKNIVLDARQAVMNVVTQLAKVGVSDLSVGKPELTPTKSASASPTVTVTGEATSGAVTK